MQLHRIVSLIKLHRIQSFIQLHFIEETSHTKIDLNNGLLDNQNKLQVQIQELIKNYGQDSVERRHRDGYYSAKLFRLVALKELVEKYQRILLDIMATSANIKITVGDQVKRDSAIDTAIRH